MHVNLNKHNLLFFVLALVGGSGCMDPFELKLGEEDVDALLVVDGRIHAGKGPYHIRLEQTAGFGTGQTAPVIGATVWIEDGRGIRENAIEDSPGKYQVSGKSIEGQVGQAYTLGIEWDGKQYVSRSEIIPEPVSISDIRYQQQLVELVSLANVPILKYIVQVDIDTPIPNRNLGPFLKWEATETYTANNMRDMELIICYFTPPLHPQDIRIFNGTGFSQPALEGIRLIERETDWTFELRHVLSVFQVSMTQEAFEYWDRVRQVINQVGSIFDSPPAPIRGNIVNIDNPQELILGYFEAVSIDTARVTIFPSDLRFGSIPPRCPFNPNAAIPPQCRPCWEHQHVSFIRPDYFN